LDRVFDIFSILIKQMFRLPNPQRLSTSGSGMNLFSERSLQYSVALAFFALLVSGCSGSSEPTSDSKKVSADVPTETPTETGSNIAIDGTVGSQNSVLGNAPLGDMPTDASREPIKPTGSENSEMGVSTPVPQDKLQIYFEIMVPIYQSNELQVSLNWGDQSLFADWVGDETWSATADWPANTEHQLTVTFSDNNGEIVLGSYEQLYRTGSNAAQSYQISAEQFDTKKWDVDVDGISNFDELISDANPFLNENLSLEVRDLVLLRNSVFFVEQYAERLPSERPYNDYLEVSELSENCDDQCAYLNRNIHNISIEIDAQGNGSIYDFHETGSVVYRNNELENVTRLVTDNGINWEGRYRYFSEASDGWVDETNFTNMVVVIDGTTRRYTGTTNQSAGADYPQGSFSSEHDLTGKTSGDSTQCKPVAGSITKKEYFESEHFKTITITKKVDDAYWKVSEMNIRDSSLSEEFFVRSLGIEDTFNCDLADLEHSASD